MASPTKQQHAIKSGSLGCEKLIIIMFFVQKVAFQKRNAFAYEK